MTSIFREMWTDVYSFHTGNQRQTEVPSTLTCDSTKVQLAEPVSLPRLFTRVWVTGYGQKHEWPQRQLQHCEPPHHRWWLMKTFHHLISPLPPLCLNEYSEMHWWVTMAAYLTRDWPSFLLCKIDLILSIAISRWFMSIQDYSLCLL